MSFAVARSGDEAQLGVYDLAGRLQKSLVQGTLDAGVHTVGWDGTDLGGSPVRAGVYFIRGRVSGNRVGSNVIVVR
jgi:flagellar hook assembly protein FlgD